MEVEIRMAVIEQTTKMAQKTARRKICCTTRSICPSGEETSTNHGLSLTRTGSAVSRSGPKRSLPIENPSESTRVPRRPSATKPSSACFRCSSALALQ